jgi:hypothetical protein
MKTLLGSLVAVAVAWSAVAAAEVKDAVLLTPEKAEATVKVGRTVYLGMPNAPGSMLSGLKVTIDGESVKLGKDDTQATGMIGIGHLNYVYKAQKPGTYKVEVTPIYQNKNKKAKPLKYTLKVEQK